jgi:hypothetical protein
MRIVLLSLIASVSGCFCVDTCPKRDSVETLMLATSPEPDAGALAFTFTRSSLNLPDEYFRAATAGRAPESDGGWVTPTAATFTAPDRYEVTLPRAVGDLVRFRLELPDREGVLKCSHPGAPDSYLLDVTFDRAATPTLSWAQSVRLGPI